MFDSKLHNNNFKDIISNGGTILIDNLSFDPRIKNALSMVAIYDLVSLIFIMDKFEHVLITKNWRNFGVKSQQKIKNFLDELGIKNIDPEIAMNFVTLESLKQYWARQIQPKITTVADLVQFIRENGGINELKNICEKHDENSIPTDTTEFIYQITNLLGAFGLDINGNPIKSVGNTANIGDTITMQKNHKNTNHATGIETTTLSSLSIYHNAFGPLKIITVADLSKFVRNHDGANGLKTIHKKYSASNSPEKETQFIESVINILKKFNLDINGNPMNSDATKSAATTEISTKYDIQPGSFYVNAGLLGDLKTVLKKLDVDLEIANAQTPKPIETIKHINAFRGMTNNMIKSSEDVAVKQ